MSSKSLYMPIPKKGNDKEYSNYCTTVLISHASKVMLKLVFNSTWTDNFQMCKLDLEKAEETETNTCWIIEKAREFQKNICLCFTDYVKAFDYVDPNKLWKIL